MSRDYNRLCKAIGYTFKDNSYLEEALTHRSASNKNNERLEFLGDAVLNFVIASELFRKFPTITEGQLSRLRSSLVKGETLASLAADLELGEYLYLGVGELKSGGHRRASILADALEAMIGAVYLDGGFEHSQTLILYLLRNLLQKIKPTDEHKDPKTRLQEYLQSNKLALPVYKVSRIEGQAHAQTFRIECQVPGSEQVTHGEGSTRRKAEQEAASKALDLLQKSG